MSKIFIASSLPHMFGKIEKTASASKDKSHEEKEVAVKSAIIDEIILSCKICGSKKDVDIEKHMCKYCIIDELTKPKDK